jgi:predicted nucleic acid-binding protein
MNASESGSPAAGVVLDTNAALDWLVFDDAGMNLLASAIECGAVRWLATARMREELLRTLTHPSLARWRPDSERALTLFDRFAFLQPEPVPTRTGPLVCSDPDDQMFIDLAMAQGAHWLVSHDRALHKLARRALLTGVRIVRPRNWTAPPPG